MIIYFDIVTWSDLVSVLVGLHHCNSTINHHI